MPHLVWTSAIVAATLAGLLAGGCSTNLPSLTSQPDDPSAALAPAGQEKKAEDKGPLASLTAMLPEAEPGVVGTPTELYTRIARGALNCWFGATGPLKGRYIYHADAKPASQGGGSVIAARERNTRRRRRIGRRALLDRRKFEAAIMIAWQPSLTAPTPQRAERV